MPLRKSVLKERGLADVFSDVPFAEQPLWELPGRGPDNRSGCLTFYQTPTGAIPRRNGYFPAEQTWTPVGDGSLLWIGIDSAEPPKPEELARLKQVRGYEIVLGDGSPWLIPVIRRCDHSTMLPRMFRRDSSGRLTEEVRPGSRRHWEAFREAAEWVIGGMEADKMPPEKSVELGVRALSINYRIGWPEQEALGLIGSDNYLLILAAAVDLPALNETLSAAKKKSDLQVELNSTPGQPGESLTTNQAGAISN